MMKKVTINTGKLTGKSNSSNDTKKIETKTTKTSKTKEIKVKIAANNSQPKPKKTETKIKIHQLKKNKNEPATIASGSGGISSSSKKPAKSKTTTTNTFTSSNSSKTTKSKSKNVDAQRFTPLFSNVSPTSAYHHVTKELGWNTMRVIAFILLVVIFVLHCIATSTRDWLDFNSVQTHGIWKICYESDYTSGVECHRYDVLPNYLKQMQALTMVALFAILGAIIYFYFWLKETSTRPLILLTIIIEIAALLMIVTMAIFTDNCFCTVARSKLGTFGWSYYLGWLTTLLTISTGVFIHLKAH